MLPSDDQRRMIVAVLQYLEDYRGEPVVKGQHPLHAAIVNLEAMCRPSPDGRCQDKLFYPASSMWFRMLWASRDGCKTIPVSACVQGGGFRHSTGNEFTLAASPVTAMQWARLLKAELSKWLEDFPQSKR